MCGIWGKINADASNDQSGGHLFSLQPGKEDCSKFSINSDIPKCKVSKAGETAQICRQNSLHIGEAPRPIQSCDFSRSKKTRQEVQQNQKADTDVLQYLEPLD